MRTHLKKLRDPAAGLEDEGFTLIELLVVLLIIGILLAIAIPTFLTVTSGAKNTAAQSNLNTALTAADTYYTQNQGSYLNLDVQTTTVSDIAQQGTGLTFTSGTPGSVKLGQVDIDYVGPNDIMLAAMAPTNNRCYVIADEKSTSGFATTSNVPLTAGTYYGYYTVTAGAPCLAAAGVTGSVLGSGTGSWQTGGFPS